MAQPTLGQRIKQAREARGLTVAEVAEAAGLSRTHVYNIERGTTDDVLSATLHRLVIAIDVPASEILPTEPVPEPTPAQQQPQPRRGRKCRSKSRRSTKSARSCARN